MRDSIVQVYRQYRHDLKVPNRDTYRRTQIRSLLLFGLASDILFAVSYLVITFVDKQYTNDTLPVALAVMFFLGIGALALLNTSLFDKYGPHLMFIMLLIISFTLVPHVSSSLLLVMLVKVVLISGVLTRPVFTWIYSGVGLILFFVMAFGHYPAVQVFGFMAIYGYVTVAGFLIAEMLNGMFKMHAQSSDSMQQLYLDDKKLFSSLAHRLKTPVAILRGQLLHNPTTKDDADIVGPLNEITAAINELTVMSKMNLSKALATKQQIDLQDLLLETTHDAQILAANHGRLYDYKRVINYVPHAFSVRPIVYIAPQQMKEALLNIIDNCIRHNDGKPTVNIDISLSHKQNRYKITIKDDGIGMSEEKLRNVLSKHTVVGDGESPIDMHVGLEISRNLIMANGGELFIYSQPDEGTTVEVALNAD